jgi:hypothetical protein
MQAVTHQNSRVTTVDVSGSWKFNPETQNVWETLRPHAQRVGGFSLTMYFGRLTQEVLRQEFARKFADCPQLEFHVDYRKKQKT